MIPAFSIQHENLNTRWVNIENYIAWLKDEYFNGYIQATTSHANYFIFFLLGEQVNIIKSENSNFLSASDDISKIFAEKEIILSSYKVSENLVTFFSQFDNLTPAHVDLSSDIVNLVNLIGKVKKEQSSGVLICKLNNNKKTLFIYFKNGSIIGYMCSSLGNILQKSNDELKKLIGELSEKSKYSLYIINGKENSQAQGNINRKYLLEKIKELFKSVEEKIGIDKTNSTIREICIDLSRQYEFLDPFSGEFEYKNGKIDVWDKISSPALKNGLVALAGELSDRLGLDNSKIIDEIKRI